ncbi:MAG TPA: hypothetical protein PLI88_01635 [Bacillota bacterium]|nr:hypothetical protein [Bacillota bacterium]HOH09552.1 hypothetical protein [Bacillota bacterium]HOY89245.1 hypothetical protein [Bacillota bacterium]HPI00835.1 hypothetical protein [Bacillota bacterium]HPM63444.1 hypothetical protein [Bacillota bacterium]
MRKIHVKFPEFQVNLVIEMDERNKALCDEVWEALPFDGVQEHSMVSGQSMYAWVPMISTAKVPVKMLRTEAPIGWCAFNQGTGNKISMKYGDLSEDLYGNSLGFIPQEYHGVLKMIGREIWANYFGDKKIYRVCFSKGA